jgi:hypothetical protein
MNKALATGAQKSLPAWNHERERNRAAVVYLVQAMARHGLGQMAEARADLAKGKQIALTQFPALDSGDLGREWQDMLIARILLREATTLIEGGTGGASPDQTTHWKKKLEEAHSP